MRWCTKLGSRGFTPAFTTASMWTLGRNSPANRATFRPRSIGPEVRRWRCDEKGWSKAMRGVETECRARRLSTVSEPPRVPHENQDLGEIARADRTAGLDHLSLRQALRHADRGTERERAPTPLD